MKEYGEKGIREWGNTTYSDSTEEKIKANCLTCSRSNDNKGLYCFNCMKNKLIESYDKISELKEILTKISTGKYNIVVRR